MSVDLFYLVVHTSSPGHAHDQGIVSVFFPGLIEDLEIVVVQVEIKEVTQGHRVPQSHGC